MTGWCFSMLLRFPIDSLFEHLKPSSTLLFCLIPQVGFLLIVPASGEDQAASPTVEGG